MTHNELVERAAKWLRNSTPSAVVITEMVSGRETPDAIGIGHFCSTLIECKASRSDFLADRKKFFRMHPDKGMGNYRYYLTPKGLVMPEELPECWGLLEVRGSRLFRIVEAENQPKDHVEENGLLVSALRRIGQNPPEGVSVKAYTYETKCTATLGIAAPTAPSASSAGGEG